MVQSSLDHILPILSPAAPQSPRREVRDAGPTNKSKFERHLSVSQQASTRRDAIRSNSSAKNNTNAPAVGHKDNSRNDETGLGHSPTLEQSANNDAATQEERHYRSRGGQANEVHNQPANSTLEFENANDTNETLEEEAAAALLLAGQAPNETVLPENRASTDNKDIHYGEGSSSGTIQEQTSEAKTASSQANIATQADANGKVTSDSKHTSTQPVVASEESSAVATSQASDDIANEGVIAEIDGEKSNIAQASNGTTDDAKQSVATGTGQLANSEVDQEEAYKNSSNSQTTKNALASSAATNEKQHAEGTRNNERRQGVKGVNASSSNANAIQAANSSNEAILENIAEESAASATAAAADELTVANAEDKANSQPTFTRTEDSTLANTGRSAESSNESARTDLEDQLPLGRKRIDPARFVNRVAKAFQTAQDRGGQLKLRLSPPELGSLQMEIGVKNGVLTATLETETTSARHLLLENLAVLRDRLEAQGIRIEQFDVNVQDDGQSDWQQWKDKQDQQDNSNNTNQPAKAKTQSEEQDTQATRGIGVRGDETLNVTV